MSESSTTELDERKAEEYAKNEVKRQIKKKLLAQCLPLNRGITLQKYIVETRQMRKSMYGNGVSQLAQRYASASVLLFAAYISRDDDDKTKEAVLNIARNFNKGVIEE